MDESNNTIHAHIRKQDDYNISTGAQNENRILVKTEKGNLLLLIDREIALKMAMDLIKAVTARIKQEVKKEIETLTDND